MSTCSSAPYQSNSPTCSGATGEPSGRDGVPAESVLRQGRATTGRRWKHQLLPCLPSRSRLSRVNNQQLLFHGYGWNRKNNGWIVNVKTPSGKQLWGGQHASEEVARAVAINLFNKCHPAGPRASVRVHGDNQNPEAQHQGPLQGQAKRSRPVVAEPASAKRLSLGLPVPGHNTVACFDPLQRLQRSPSLLPSTQQLHKARQTHGLPPASVQQSQRPVLQSSPDLPTQRQILVTAQASCAAQCRDLVVSTPQLNASQARQPASLPAQTAALQELSPKHRAGLNARAAAWYDARQELSKKTHDMLDACGLLCPGPASALSAEELLRQQYPDASVLHLPLLRLLCPGAQ